MRNFPYAQNPKNWSEYYGQPHAVNIAKKFLTDEPLQSLFVSGESGVGKTAFVLLLIKAARCLNRKPDEIEPCNECANCLQGDPRKGDPNLTDVWWIQPGADASITLNKSVKEAMIAAQSGHKHTGRDNDILFIVFDEFQRFPSDLRQPLLWSAEVPTGNNVCFIFITMKKEQLDPTEWIAFTRRQRDLVLKPYSEVEIFEYLISRFPECPLETATIIARHSRRSIGLALSYYDSIKEESNELDPEVAAAIIGCASNNHREKLWGALQAKVKINKLNEYLEGLYTVTDRCNLARQLIQDVINTIDISFEKTKGDPSDNQLLALRLLNQFLANHANTDLLSYLLQLYGLEIVYREAIYCEPDYALKYSVKE